MDRTGHRKSFFDANMEDVRGGSLQPLSYARELARAALGQGQKYVHKAQLIMLKKER